MVTPYDPSPWERSPCQVVPFSSSISRLGASSQLPAVMPAGCSGSRPWGPRLPHRWYPLRGEKQHASYCLPLPPSLLSVPVGATLRWYGRYCAVALAGCWLSSGKGVTQCPGIQPLFPWPPARRSVGRAGVGGSVSWPCALVCRQGDHSPEACPEILVLCWLILPDQALAEKVPRRWDNGLQESGSLR